MAGKDSWLVLLDSRQLALHLQGNIDEVPFTCIGAHLLLIILLDESRSIVHQFPGSFISSLFSLVSKHTLCSAGQHRQVFTNTARPRCCSNNALPSTQNPSDSHVFVKCSQAVVMSRPFSS
jgi:hypothetical protein